MPWLQAHLIVASEETAAVEAIFETLGALSITLGDAQDEPVFETLPDEIRLWSKTRITALFDYPDDNDRFRQQISQSLEREPGQQLKLEIIEDQDWERAWLKHFKPVKFGKNLWICPTGFQIEEADAIIIDLDPGLAFGTGTHPTTALCLEWLDHQDLDNARILDFGCGSGILAIAALKLGARQATAIDHDPQALTATLDNAEKNHVAGQLVVTDNSRLPEHEFDIVIANILASVLIELGETLARQVKPHGKIALSGILQEQAEAVLNSFSPWFDMTLQETREQWVLLEGTKIQN